MKLTELRAEGHCGIQIDLNIMDQYAITHVIDRWNKAIGQKQAREDWDKKRDADRVWKMSDEERKIWENNNPKPEIDPINWFDEMGPVYNFLKKLVLNGDSKPTVFDE